MITRPPVRAFSCSSKGSRRIHANKPAVAHQATHDGAVLLLHMRLIVLSISARARHFQTLAAAPGDDKCVHERTVVVEVDAQQRKGKPRAGLFHRHDHITAVTCADRDALGPACGNIGQHHRLQEASRRRRAGTRGSRAIGGDARDICGERLGRFTA